MALEDTRIAVLGLWHLGSVYSAGLADLGYQVVGMDDDGERVVNLNRGLPPLFEPGLAELISRNLAEKRLTYTTQMASAVRGAAFVLLTYDTPVDDRDRVDLSGLFAAAREVARHLESGAVVVVSSQVPVGTCHQIESLIQEENPHLDFGIAYCPENLRLGQALRVFRQPDFLVIGAESPATLDRVAQLFASIDAPKVRMDLKSAEMTKHAINAFLGMSISYINELANLCDEVGADAVRVASALKMDRRIGPGAPLFPGLGFAGGTLARDLRVLQRLGDERSYPTSLVDAVLRVNRRQNRMVVRRLERFYGSLAGLTIAVLGLAYKAGTSTLRRSSALEIIAQLVRRGARVKAHDPKADPGEVRRHREFQFCLDPYEAVEAADGLVIITNWPEFKELDFERMKSLMKRPFILDAQNMLNGDELLQKGFTYVGIGRGRRL